MGEGIVAAIVATVGAEAGGFAATVAIPALVGAVETGAVGAGIGALGAAVTGNDIGSGALMGGLSGAVTGGIMSGFTGSVPFNGAGMFAAPTVDSVGAGASAAMGSAPTIGAANFDTTMAMGGLNASPMTSAAANAAAPLDSSVFSAAATPINTVAAASTDPTLMASAINPTGSIADAGALQVASANNFKGLEPLTSPYVSGSVPVTDPVSGNVITSGAAAPANYINADTAAGFPVQPNSLVPPLTPVTSQTLPATSSISASDMGTNVAGGQGLAQTSANQAGALNMSAQPMATTTVPGEAAIQTAATDVVPTSTPVKGLTAADSSLTNYPAANQAGTLNMSAQPMATTTVPGDISSSGSGLFGKGLMGAVSKGALGFGITSALAQMMSPPKQLPVSMAQNGDLATASQTNQAKSINAPLAPQASYLPTQTPSSTNPWATQNLQNIYGPNGPITGYDANGTPIYGQASGTWGGGGPAQRYFTTSSPGGSAASLSHGGHAEHHGALADHEPHEQVIHHGVVRGRGDGAADEVPASIPDGSYILRADEVAALGRGSTDAGVRALDQSFGPQPPGGGQMVKAALSDGEYVISPHVVTMIGEGDNDEGARRLDRARDNLAKLTGRKDRKSAASHGGALSKLVGGRVV